MSRPHVHTLLMRFIEIVLSALYEPPLKWEKSAEGCVTWCEASVHMVRNALTLLMKGVAWQPLGHTFPLVGNYHLWDRWVDASSSIVEFALKSRVPTLVGKVATLCFSTRASSADLRSIVMGFGSKGYEWNWRWRPLVTTLARCDFQDRANLQMIERWVSQGQRPVRT